MLTGLERQCPVRLFGRWTYASAIAACLVLSGAAFAADPTGHRSEFSLAFGKVPKDLMAWQNEVARKAPGWAAAIGRRLPPKAPIGRVTILIDEEDDFVALATGRTIIVSAAYLRKAPDDVGVIGHELVHMYQDYPAGSEGWLVEGLADYVRYYQLEPGSARGTFAFAEADYRSGYQAAAWFLRHVETAYGCALIVRLHHTLRAGLYDPGFWKRRTGLNADEVWAQAKAAATRNPALLRRASRC